jgi:phosphoenolpyruvate carboxylase
MEIVRERELRCGSRRIALQSRLTINGVAAGLRNSG